MDTRTGRTLAACIGALGLVVAAGLVLFWWKHPSDGPGDIGLAVLTLLIACAQGVPLAGLVAVLWHAMKRWRFVFLVFAIPLSLFGALYLLVPVLAMVATTAVIAYLLIAGSRATFVAWVIAAVPCVAIGLAALAFLLML